MTNRDKQRKVYGFISPLQAQHLIRQLPVIGRAPRGFTAGALIRAGLSD
jgi:hypothetical protein